MVGSLESGLLYRLLLYTVWLVEATATELADAGKRGQARRASLEGVPF